MPTNDPIHIVLDRHGYRIDASAIINQLRKIEYEHDWSHPETQAWIDELGGQLISATGTHHAPAVLVARLSRHVSARFRAHLKASWQRVAEACR